MSEKDPKSVISHCSQCHVEVRLDPSTGEAPSFCLNCRFPLMLVSNKYCLKRIIGEGGFATVYEAELIGDTDTKEQRRVIKVLKPELLEEESAHARFRREVKVTATVSQHSQHIIRIFDDYGEIPNFGTYYVMEYLDGHSLHDVMKDADGLLSLDRCYRFFKHLCSAMCAAHREGIIHRDLKPENLLITTFENQVDWLKVIDFGIAKPVGNKEAITQLTQGALGTPAYMAPELYLNQEVTAATDIYAMGVILFEMLVGFTPFASPNLPAPTAASFMASHLMQEPPHLSESLPKDRVVPGALDDVIQQCLTKKPEERFISIEALLEAFLWAIGEKSDLDVPVLKDISNESRPGVLFQAFEESFGGLATSDSGANLNPKQKINPVGEYQTHGKTNPSLDREIEAKQPIDFDSLGDTGEGTALDFGPIDELLLALDPNAQPVERTVIQKHPDLEGSLQGAETVNESVVFVDPQTFPDGDFQASKHNFQTPSGFAAPDLVGHQTAEQVEGTAVSAPPTGLGELLAGTMTHDELSAFETPSHRHSFASTAPTDETTGSSATVFVELQDAESNKRMGAKQKQKLVILIAICLGFLLFLGFGAMAFFSDEHSLQTSIKKRQGAIVRQKKSPSRWLSQKVPPSKQVKEVPAHIEPAIPDKRAKVRRAPIPSIPRHRSRRRKRGRYASRCPRWRGYIWTSLRIRKYSSYTIPISFSKGRGVFKKRRRRICVGVRNLRVRVSLGNDQIYSVCSFFLSKRSSKLTISLQKKGSGLEPSAPDYCIRR